MAYTTLKDLLILHEGVRRFPYHCTAGKLTIGVGFNLDDVGLYPEEIDFILQNRVLKMLPEVRKEFPWFDGLSDVRKAVILDMTYNMGLPTLRTFKRTLGSVARGEYALASVQMLQSKWAKQVGRRAKRLAQMMRDDQWPVS